MENQMPQVPTSEPPSAVTEPEEKKNRKTLRIITACIITLSILFSALGFYLVRSKSGPDASDTLTHASSITPSHQTSPMNQNFPQKLTDLNADTASPAGVVALYYKLLGQGDITAAAGVTTDSQASVTRWTSYRDRIGASEFVATFQNPAMVIAKVLNTKDATVVVLSDGVQKYVNVAVKNGNEYRIMEDPTGLSAETVSAMQAELE